MKKTTLTLLLMGIFTLSTGIVFAETISLTPSMDTYVEYGSTLDYSSDDYITAEDHGSMTTGFVQWDLTPIPTGATINSATAYFNLAGITSTVGGPRPSMYFHTVNESWTDSTITWADIYGDSAPTSSGPTIENDFFNSTAFITYDVGLAPYPVPVFDFTAQTLAWLSGDNYGIALTPNWDILGGISFSSTERDGYPPRNPYLLVDYTIGGGAPVPEPATFILLGSGLAGLAFYRRKRK